jgi:hypothetical protein
MPDCKTICRIALFLIVFGYPTAPAHATPSLLNASLQMRLVLYTTNSTGANSVRIARNPGDSQLYYLKINGDIFRVTLIDGSGSTSTQVYSSIDHGLSTSVLGMTFGPDGTLYLVGNLPANGGASNVGQIMKGVPSGNGGRTWSLLAQTEPYPRSETAFDHSMSGIVVSPDGSTVYVNSGSRTDHGEVESTGGTYPNLREADLTAKILRLPTTASNLILPNDITALRAGGYVFVEGTRNAFDLAFAPNGDFFATENGPDRDMSDSLYWLRAGSHYGFPWRMGGADNPQQFPNYDPSSDLLLDARYVAVQTGKYQNDPSFPMPPTNITDPVINVGPDACSFRDPSDGSPHVASALGPTLSTLTAHRSPLGLVFDTASAMAPPFQQHGFMLSWTAGDPTGNTVPGPFLDPGQDLVDLNLTKLGATNYQASVTRILGGFSNPIDAEIVGNKIYVIEHGGNQGIWEITFPPAITEISSDSPVLARKHAVILAICLALLAWVGLRAKSAVRANGDLHS